MTLVRPRGDVPLPTHNPEVVGPGRRADVTKEGAALRPASMCLPRRCENVHGTAVSLGQLATGSTAR